MLWSQLRAGFLLIFFALFGLLSYELFHITLLTPNLTILFAGFSLYIMGNWNLRDL